MITRIILAVSAITALGTPAFAQSATGKAQVIFIPDDVNSKVTARTGSPGVAVVANEVEGVSLDATVGAGKKVGKLNFPTLSGLVSIGTIPAGAPPNVDYFYAGQTGTGTCGDNLTPGCDDRVVGVSHTAGDQGALTYVGYGASAIGSDTGVVPTTPQSSYSLWMAGGYFGTEATSADTIKSYKTANVTATYAGGFFGIAADVGGKDHDSNPLGVNGDVSLTANFKKGTVTGLIDGITVYGTDDGDVALDQRIAITAKIKGSDYSGTAKVINAADTKAAGSGSSAVNGTFFGPAADETAGGLRLESKFNPTHDGGISLSGGQKSPIAIVGGFGAKKTSP